MPLSCFADFGSVAPTLWVGGGVTVRGRLVFVFDLFEIDIFTNIVIYALLALLGAYNPHLAVVAIAGVLPPSAR